MSHSQTQTLKCEVSCVFFLFWQIHINYERAQCQLLTRTLPVNILCLTLMCFFIGQLSTILAILKFKVIVATMVDKPSTGQHHLFDSRVFLHLHRSKSLAPLHVFPSY